ncbi:MAG TPA: hypothetical protein VFM28_12005 [Nitrososphaeraceae archaeon]|nr:hypothetical protein [Nitrososphaeraceae archaeon]
MACAFALVVINGGNDREIVPVISTIAKKNGLIVVFLDTILLLFDIYICYN